MLEKLKSTVDYLNPWKTIPAFREAWKKAKEHKDKGFFEKVKIFFSTFKQEMQEVEEEKREVTEETKKKVEQGVDETMKDAQEGANLSKDVNDLDRKFYEQTLVTAVASIEELDEKNQGSAYSGVEKLKKAAKGDPKKLEFAELRALGAVSFMTLKKLKEKYSDKEKFKTALERFSKISNHSDFPLDRLLSSSTLKIFKIIELPKGPFDAVTKIGDMMEVSEFTGSLGIETDDFLTLAGLTSSPLKDKDKAEIAKVLKKSLFPHSSPGNLGKVAEILNRMIVNKVSKIDIDTLGDLVFLIDNDDFDHLANILLGKKKSALAAAA